MALGPGKYDDICTMVREQTGARLVALIVVGGKMGNGFAAQGLPELVRVVPAALRSMADEIEADVT